MFASFCGVHYRLTDTYFCRKFPHRCSFERISQKDTTDIFFDHNSESDGVLFIGEPRNQEAYCKDSVWFESHFVTLMYYEIHLLYQDGLCDSTEFPYANFFMFRVLCVHGFSSSHSLVVFFVVWRCCCESRPSVDLWMCLVVHGYV